MEIEAGQTGAHFRGGTAIKLLKHLALATLAVASLLAGTGTQHAAADPPAPAVTAIQPISGGAEGIDFIDNSVEGQPVVPVSPPDPTVDYGACAICNVPPYLQPGPQTLVFRPAATAVFGHIHRELAPLETDCLDALPYPTMGLEVGFYNYAGEGALFGCNLNIIWQAGFRFDLSMLRQARATGRWFPTDAVLTFKETPYPDAKDDPAHGGHWQNGEGDELPTQTCWLRLAAPTTDWSSTPSRDLTPNDVIREAGDIGRWSVYLETLGMVTDPGNERLGFLLLGQSESVDTNDAVCRSRIEDVKLTVSYTIGDVPPPAPAPLQIAGPSTFKPPTCTVCTILGTAPAQTQPDLAVPTVAGDKTLAQGLTSVYSIGVSNLGTKPQTQVQVAIQVTGAVEYVGLDQTPAGWDCSGSSPILCAGPLGGSGDPVQNLVVSFQLRVRGAKAGTGAITATADPNGLIQESNETNNSNQIVITVK